MDRARLTARISAALQRRAPETNRKGWYFKLADALEVHPDTVRTWVYGEGCPDAAALLRLFSHFPDDFEAEIRQDTPPERRIESIADLCARIRELCDEADR